MLAQKRFYDLGPFFLVLGGAPRFGLAFDGVWPKAQFG
jgi:hypothetical protein